MLFDSCLPFQLYFQLTGIMFQPRDLLQSLDDCTIFILMPQRRTYTSFEMKHHFFAENLPSLQYLTLFPQASIPASVLALGDLGCDSWLTYLLCLLGCRERV